MRDAFRFRKSSRSNGGNGGACVEVADNLAGVVAVRDSKNVNGSILSFDPAGWSAFLTGIKAGEFDVPARP